MTEDDLLEANHINALGARIFRLASGNFALFAPYEAGGDLLGIGSIEDLLPLIPNAQACLAWHKQMISRQRIFEAKREAKEKHDLHTGQSLIAALGLVKPRTPLRRI